MRIRTRLALTAVLAAATLAAPQADAQGVATGDVNLRSGPGQGFARLTTIPRGAPLAMHGCLTSGWCDVSLGHMRGWAFGRYVASARPAVQFGWYGHARMVAVPGWGGMPAPMVAVTPAYTHLGHGHVWSAPVMMTAPVMPGNWSGTGYVLVSGTGWR
jgi:hypothetical protein